MGKHLGVNWRCEKCKRQEKENIQKIIQMEQEKETTEKENIEQKEKNKEEIKDKENQIKEKDTQIEEMKKAGSEIMVDLNKTREQLEIQRTQSSTLNVELENIKEKIENERIESYQTISGLENQIASKHAGMNELLKEIEEKTNEVIECKNKINEMIETEKTKMTIVKATNSSEQTELNGENEALKNNIRRLETQIEKMKSSLEEKERKLGNLANNYLRKEETERINKEKYDSLTIENNQLKKRLEIKEISNNGNIDRIHELVEENLKYKNTEKEQKIETEKLKKNQEEKSEKIKELEKEILDERENIISKIREGTSGLENQIASKHA